MILIIFYFYSIKYFPSIFYITRDNYNYFYIFSIWPPASPVQCWPTLLYSAALGGKLWELPASAGSGRGRHWGGQRRTTLQVAPDTQEKELLSHHNKNNSHNNDKTSGPDRPTRKEPSEQERLSFPVWGELPREASAAERQENKLQSQWAAQRIWRSKKRKREKEVVEKLNTAHL